MSDGKLADTGRGRSTLRGLVLTGGGGKGLYEAGVVHALHITGMEFDVITGSSIGALNGVFFAEYLYRRHQLPPDTLQDPLMAVERMDRLVKAYHHAWLDLPEQRLIDDSEQGPVGKLKDDLLEFQLSLPAVVRFVWWWTDPRKGALPPVQLWPSLLGLLNELAERLGGAQEVLRIAKDHRSDLIREAMRTYLARFGMKRSLVPPGDDEKLRDVFTQPTSPLTEEDLLGSANKNDSRGNEDLILIEPTRTLKDYRESGIAVRLTRANYRTGRLEISAWVPMHDFVRFMQKQAWRLDVFGPDQLPLGSFRLQVPGNPNAINAAICSGRFPGVFAPYRIQDLYPSSDLENAPLSKMLTDWLMDPEVENAMRQAYENQGEDMSLDKWTALYSRWKQSATIREFFPRLEDTYVDGGAIDNTPTNPAVDFAKEWAEREDLPRRQVALDLFVIFLDTEPKLDMMKARDPTLFDVVDRTLAIQGAAKRSSDANTVSTINTFGKRSEDLGQVLRALLDSYRESLTKLAPADADLALERLREMIREILPRMQPAKSPTGVAMSLLDRIDQWSKDLIAEGLPLDVDVVKIYPEQMPLSTLQLTERLGYRRKNAIMMLTMGCADTLTALRDYFRKKARGGLDDRDRPSLALIEKWTGNLDPSGGQPETLNFHADWHCHRTACVFHARFCQRGAGRLTE